MAAAELELITHLFYSLAETRTEQQKMPKHTPCALFKWPGLKDRKVTMKCERAGLRGNLENCPFWLYDRN